MLIDIGGRQGKKMKYVRYYHISICLISQSIWGVQVYYALFNLVQYIIIIIRWLTESVG